MIKIVAISDGSGGLYKKDGIDVDSAIKYMEKHRTLRGYDEEGITSITTANTDPGCPRLRKSGAFSNKVNYKINVSYQ
ncbi:MAG: hypothetical protein ACOY3J_02495 [Bacillota bacterium]